MYVEQVIMLHEYLLWPQAQFKGLILKPKWMRTDKMIYPNKLIRTFQFDKVNIYEVVWNGFYFFSEFFEKAWYFLRFN